MPMIVLLPLSAPRLQDDNITFPLLSKRVDTLHAILLSPHRFRTFIYCS